MDPDQLGWTGLTLLPRPAAAAEERRRPEHDRPGPVTPLGERDLVECPQAETLHGPREQAPDDEHPLVGDGVDGVPTLASIRDESAEDEVETGCYERNSPQGEEPGSVVARDRQPLPEDGKAAPDHGKGYNQRVRRPAIAALPWLSAPAH